MFTPTALKGFALMLPNVENVGHLRWFNLISSELLYQHFSKRLDRCNLSIGDFAEPLRDSSRECTHKHFAMNGIRAA